MAPVANATCCTAAAQVAAINDIMMQVFAHLGLAERLRLAAVCKEWRSALSELRVPRELAWRTGSIVRAAGPSLRNLCLPQFWQAGCWKITSEDLVQALLRSGAGAELHSLVLWELPEQASSEEGSFSYLSSEHASSLISACPNLGPSTRIPFGISTAAAAISLLDALPGRHGVQLVPPVEPEYRFESEELVFELSGNSPAYLQQLLRHPRMAAMDLDNANYQSDERGYAEACMQKAYAAILDGLSFDGQAGGCSIQHLRTWNCDVSGWGEFACFGSSAQAVHAAFDAAAAAEPGGAPPCSLESLHVPDGMMDNAFLTAVLLACGHGGGQLRNLYIEELSQVVQAPDEREGGWGSALPALLERICGMPPRLESLSIKTDRNLYEGSLDLGVLTGILASDRCRLRSLVCGGACLDSLADVYDLDSSDADAEEAGSFFCALSANQSLRTLALPCCRPTGGCTRRLMSAIAQRAAPLEALDISFLPLRRSALPKPTIIGGLAGGASGGGAGSAARLASLQLDCRKLCSELGLAATAALIPAMPALLSLSLTDLHGPLWQSSSGVAAAAIWAAVGDHTSLTCFRWCAALPPTGTALLSQQGARPVLPTRGISASSDL